MFKVLSKQILSHDVKRLDVLAPDICAKVRPGQFVSVCPFEGDERIPLAVIDSDKIKKSIVLIFQEVGQTTKKLGEIPINEPIFSILGPLGVPATISKKGIVVCISTGVGTAQMLPIARAFKNAGNKVIGIIGARTRKSLILESQMRITCSKIFITTDDGTYEKKGRPTDVLQALISQHSVDQVYSIGSVDMLEAICQITLSKNISTYVHLNPVMADCMGMCGSCRVKVGGEMVLACTDGPEFDGHKVDFNDLKIRMNAFKEIGSCLNLESPLATKQNETGIFKRFLSDILKK